MTDSLNNILQVFLGKPERIQRWFHKQIQPSPQLITLAYYGDANTITTQLLETSASVYAYLLLPNQIQTQNIDLLKELCKHSCVTFHRIGCSMYPNTSSTLIKTDMTAAEVQYFVKEGIEFR